jgi:hypothetical protein
MHDNCFQTYNILNDLLLSDARMLTSEDDSTSVIDLRKSLMGVGRIHLKLGFFKFVRTAHKS